jgi:hypothetical protein
MINSINILALSRTLTGTVSACRFLTPAGTVAGADANTIGVARSAGVSGDLITVDVLGTAMVEAGAAISAGATVKSDSSGRAIPWATSGAKVGLALTAASAMGDLIEVLLIPNG